MKLLKDSFRRKLSPNVRSKILKTLRYTAPPNWKSKQSYRCPACGYRGPFLRARGISTHRDAAICLNCGAKERHRLQAIVIENFLPDRGHRNGKALHFAPDAALIPVIESRFDYYLTADISRVDVNLRVDMRSMPFEDESFDLVYASHVLEHVDDDNAALSEVSRVLRPGGFALLPVPINSDRTIEYPEPVPTEHNHVRAPGLDYFSRYQRHFSRVDIFTSDDAPAECQCYVIEDRSGFPTKEAPFRPPQQGVRHLDAVPICRK